MKQLQIRLLALILGLALFFNIERLGDGGGAGIGPQTFVYGLVTLAVVTVVASAILPRRPLLFITLLWLPVYLIARWFIFDRYPLVGGIYSYITWTEFVFVAFLLAVAYLVARALAEFREGVAYLAILQAGGHLPSVDEEADKVDAEVSRSRENERPLSLVAIQLDSDALSAQVDPLVESALSAIGTRYARLHLVDEMRQVLRPIDLLLQAHEDDTLLLLCPEAGSTGCKVLADRARAVLDGAGVPSRYAIATFPDEALTFDALVDRSREKLVEDAATASAARRQTVLTR